MRLYGSVLAVGLMISGCSSNNSAPAGGGAGDDGSAPKTIGSAGGDAGSCGDSPAVWKEDGVLRCGTSGEAILSTNTTLNPLDGGTVVTTSLEVVILQPTTSYIFSFIVTTSDAFGGTYTCAIGTTSNVELEYDEVGVFSSTTSSCSVSVTLTPADGGMIATGTFSAELAVTDGGVKTLSDGTFTFGVTGL
ncbi:MAG TPA: hypothetical protein VK841_15720 [Polyangiaceae bacterium]|jgi:hypothetical protein|nr:hypothetical protein [Polyangiaceae bacterium]